MKNLLLAVCFAVAISIGMGQPPKYSLVKTCTDVLTGETVSLKKCNGNNPNYSGVSFCRDNVTKETVDASLCNQ